MKFIASIITIAIASICQLADASSESFPKLLPLLPDGISDMGKECPIGYRVNEGGNMCFLVDGAPFDNEVLPTLLPTYSIFGGKAMKCSEGYQLNKKMCRIQGEPVGKGVRLPAYLPAVQCSQCVHMICPVGYAMLDAKLVCARQIKSA